MPSMMERVIPALHESNVTMSNEIDLNTSGKISASGISIEYIAAIVGFASVK